MKELTFTFTLEEANIIMASLGKQPYDTVFDVVTKLRAQAQSQLQALEAANTEEAPNKK